MYQFKDSDDEHILLHDCRAVKASVKNGILSFYFPDGFWIGRDHKSNSLKQTVRTDASKVKFHPAYGDDADVTIYLYTKMSSKKTVRRKCKLKKFIKKINNGSYQLEFLYPYKGYNTIKYDCCLWFDKKPYCLDCELVILTGQATYYWNRLCEDKPW